MGIKAFHYTITATTSWSMLNTDTLHPNRENRLDTYYRIMVVRTRGDETSLIIDMVKVYALRDASPTLTLQTAITKACMHKLFS